MIRPADSSRCINLDWLEVFCTEATQGFPHDARYFVSKGYQVRVRDYATRQYHQMFTILDRDGQAFCEIRRDPVSGDDAKRTLGIFNPYNCHIRLSNRYCYHPDAINVFSEFLMQHGYTVERLYRLDLCMDFEKFDDGTDPKKFLQRYMDGRFTKINQGNVSAHGTDRWESRDWNSLSWGAPTSMVSTKFYNKTIELKTVKDKPYIRGAWFSSGLVDSFQYITKQASDGTTYEPQIWRVEFSIRSSAKGWFIKEDNASNKTRTMKVPHALGSYATAGQRLQAFANLCHCYFHFKYYEEGVRKDRCRDKVLFDWGTCHEVYRLDRLLTEAKPDRSIEQLKLKLIHYRERHFDMNIRKACTLLIEQLDSEAVRQLSPTYSNKEAMLLQMLLKRRLNHPDESYSESVDVLEAMLTISNEIF